MGPIIQSLSVPVSLSEVTPPIGTLQIDFSFSMVVQLQLERLQNLKFPTFTFFLLCDYFL